MIGELVNRKRSSVLSTQHSRSLEGYTGEICMNVFMKLPIVPLVEPPSHTNFNPNHQMSVNSIAEASNEIQDVSTKGRFRWNT